MAILNFNGLFDRSLLIVSTQKHFQKRSKLNSTAIRIVPVYTVISLTKVISLISIWFRVASIYVLYQCWKERKDALDGIYGTTTIAPSNISASVARSASRVSNRTPANMEANGKKLEHKLRSDYEKVAHSFLWLG